MPKFTAIEIVDILKKKHAPPCWVSFTELRTGTGYGKDSKRRIDFWCLHTYPSKKHLKIVYEIKVSKTDFMHEISQPRKRRAALNLSNEFYFIAPKGIIPLELVPSECGLIEVTDDKQLKTVKVAPFRACDKPDWVFIASVGRRIFKEESIDLAKISDMVLDRMAEALHKGSTDKLTIDEITLYNFINKEQFNRRNLQYSRTNSTSRKHNSFFYKLRRIHPNISYDESDKLWNELSLKYKTISGMIKWIAKNYKKAE